MSHSLPHRARRGLSLIELLMFIGIVSIALAALLRVFVQSTSASADPVLRRQALAIAESLMEEVQLMPLTWCDSEDATVDTATSAAGCTGAADAIGPEAGESRMTLPSFDHVNDYHGFTMNGITDLTGAAIPGLAVYNASVAVAADTLHSITAASGDALRITVTVTGPGGTSVVLQGYRSRHAPNASL
jgi:MSHA pilin protein MshD